MGENMGWRGCIILLMILGIASLVPLTAAADDNPGAGLWNGIRPQEIPLINQSEINTTALDPYHPTPSPVTIFRTELHETSLSGPRYMAFGPSTIEFSADPVALFFLGIVVLLGAAAAGFWICREKDRD